MKKTTKIKIGGEERPIKFGMNQSILYTELRGISVTKMNEEFASFGDGTFNGSEIRDLIWSSLADGARVEGLDFEYTNLDVGDWMEDSEPDFLEKFMVELMKTLPKESKKK